MAAAAAAAATSAAADAAAASAATGDAASDAGRVDGSRMHMTYTCTCTACTTLAPILSLTLTPRYSAAAAEWFGLVSALRLNSS